MAGELVYMALTRSLAGLVRAADFIQERTGDGTVGIIGFMLLFVGFVLQMVGTYAGAP
jgi:hypothetical protein